MKNEEQISREFAVSEVRNMAFQFSDLYFTFVSELRERLGEEEAITIATRVLFRRAAERAFDMVRRAEAEGVARIPENINRMTDVPFLGWDASFGRDLCPYGAAWNRRIAENPWFQRFARLYCDVTDTTIAEIFTGCYSHRLYHNVVLGDDACEREYFLSDSVREGKWTYGALPDGMYANK